MEASKTVVCYVPSTRIRHWRHAIFERVAGKTGAKQCQRRKREISLGLSPGALRCGDGGGKSIWLTKMAMVRAPRNKKDRTEADKTAFTTDELFAEGSVN
jgi:hypothetical protein